MAHVLTATILVGAIIIGALVGLAVGTWLRTPAPQREPYLWQAPGPVIVGAWLGMLAFIPLVLLL